MISRNIKTVIDLTLGDGSLRKRDRDTFPIFDTTHTIRQKQYAEHKADMLRIAGLSVISKEYAGTGKNTGKQYYRVYSHQHPINHTAYKYLYNSGRKAIDKHVLRLLDAESFAYLFLDDGGPSTAIYTLDKTLKRIYENRFATRYSIATQSFTFAENTLLVEWMKEKLDLVGSVYQEKSGACLIYVRGIENMNRLRAIVLPYATPDMIYKFSYQHGSKGIPYTTMKRNNDAERLNDVTLIPISDAIVQ